MHIAEWFLCMIYSRLKAVALDGPLLNAMNGYFPLKESKLTAWQWNSDSGIIFLIFREENRIYFGLMKVVSWTLKSKRFLHPFYNSEEHRKLPSTESDGWSFQIANSSWHRLFQSLTAGFGLSRRLTPEHIELEVLRVGPWTFCK